MSGHSSYQVRSRGAVRCLAVALGVLWSPASPRRRRISARLLLPGHRRNGAVRRRGRHSAQQVTPGAVAPLAFRGLGVLPVYPATI